MLRSLTRTPTGVLGHPTCLPDDSIGFDHTTSFCFDPENKNKARKDFGNQTFATRNVQGQPSIEDSSPGLEHCGSGLSWLSGPPKHPYWQEPLYSSYQPSTQDELCGGSDAVLPSSNSWHNTGEYTDQTCLTSSSVPDLTFTNPYEEQQMTPLQYSTSTLTSNTDFTNISQDQDIFSANSPSPPTSPPGECQSMQSTNSRGIATWPSSHSNPPSSRKLSRVSSTESEDQDPISCSNCSTYNTSLWRRSHDGQPVCNACGLFTRLHGIPRPLSLKTDIVKRRRRERSAGTSTTGKSGTRTRTSRREAKALSISEYKGR
jgi:GATA zinc finger